MVTLNALPKIVIFLKLIQKSLRSKSCYPCCVTLYLTKSSKYIIWLWSYKWKSRYRSVRRSCCEFHAESAGDAASIAPFRSESRSLGRLIRRVCWLKSFSVGISLYLWASESPTVTELELSNCLLPYSYSPYFKHLGMKTLTKIKIKTLPNTAENLRFIHFNHPFPGLILRDYPFYNIARFTLILKSVFTFSSCSTLLIGCACNVIMLIIIIIIWIFQELQFSGFPVAELQCVLLLCSYPNIPP